METIREAAHQPMRGAVAIALAAIVASGCGPGDAGSSEDSPNASVAPRVSILEPADGAELVGGQVRVVLLAENIELAPAGDDRSGTGHLHLFINQPVTEAGVTIPAGEAGIVHMGQAQTSWDLTDLSPGEYTVIAVLGDYVHRTIDPQAMDTVRFRVRAS